MRTTPCVISWCVAYHSSFCFFPFSKKQEILTVLINNLLLSLLVMLSTYCTWSIHTCPFCFSGQHAGVLCKKKKKKKQKGIISPTIKCTSRNVQRCKSSHRQGHSSLRFSSFSSTPVTYRVLIIVDNSMCDSNWVTNNFYSTAHLQLQLVLCQVRWIESYISLSFIDMDGSADQRRTLPSFKPWLPGDCLTAQ